MTSLLKTVTGLIYNFAFNKNMGHSRPLFLYFWLFNTAEIKQINVRYKSLPMTGFEPRISGIRSDCPTNWATPLPIVCFGQCLQKCIEANWVSRIIHRYGRKNQFRVTLKVPRSSENKVFTFYHLARQLHHPLSEGINLNSKYVPTSKQKVYTPVKINASN